MAQLVARSGWVCLCRFVSSDDRSEDGDQAWLDAWIPVLNFILMCWIAGRSAWWLLLFIILGLFNQNVAVIGVIIFGAILCMGMAGARGKPVWIGLLMFVPVVNVAVMGYLAFSNDKTA